MVIAGFPGPGLTEAQWQEITSLAKSLDARQLAWVSGFLAGVEHSAQGRQETSGPPAARVSAQARTLTILYGTETGNSAALARNFAALAEAGGLAARARDMAEYKTRELKDENDLLIVTSTYGEGDPPQPALGFFEFIEGRKAPKLPDLRFAVLSLGDSTYERYCEAGKRLDRRFEELGATRLRERVDCDIDYEEPAAAWIGDVLDLVRGERAAAPGPATLAAIAATSAQAYDKAHPFPARIVENVVLTGRGSSKETRHIELSVEGAGLTFEPGDSLGIMARNDPTAVEALLAQLDLAASAPLALKGRATSLGDALAGVLEITTLTPRFLDHWARIADAADLALLALPERAAERAAFMRENHVIDVIRRFPVKRIDAEVLVAGLRPLQPRLYSIASSQSAAPDEVHLTVSTVRYALHGVPRLGVASGHLAQRGEIDSMLPAYVQPNPHFRLPADDVPIIMVGAGTGVAPYRAFMQERELRGATGRSWLVFGDRHFRTDFLYQTEWQALLKANVLTRLDVAFSRDRASRETGKTYVQHRLSERSRDIFGWLQEGAHLYVCGDASRLAPDVHRTLTDLVAAEGGLGPDVARDYVSRLQSEHRYQVDVY